MRLFCKLNPTYLKFCQATLSQAASEYQGFTMELRGYFPHGLPTVQHDRQAISFGVISHEFRPIYMRLRESFKEVVGDSMKNPSTCERSEQLDWWRKLKAERNLDQWNVIVIEPRVFLGTVPTHEVDQVVKNLATQYGGRFWTVKVIGSHLGFDSRSDITRDSTFVRDFQEFPFKGSL
jgi:hypothetical protein